MKKKLKKGPNLALLKKQVELNKKYEEQQSLNEERIRKEEEEEEKRVAEEKILKEDAIRKRLAVSNRPKIFKQDKKLEEKRRAMGIILDDDGKYIVDQTKIVVSQQKKEKEVKEDNIMDKFEEKNLRSPIYCVLGHVDTGKTKLLDHIRNTNVQGGEAGGITQQIGATFIPICHIMERSRNLVNTLKKDFSFQIPGLLIIDTPGHESFSNLRHRGANICDIAILVIDIMRGIKQQTSESIDILIKQKIPFIIALNKIDKLYDWSSKKDLYFTKSFEDQQLHTKQDFDNRLLDIKNKLLEKGLNTKLYFNNQDPTKIISIIPTSAHTGEGIADLLLVMVQVTQKFMVNKITCKDKFVCVILETKETHGFGNTVDAILVNGTLKRNDKIMLCTFNRPIETTVRTILTPKSLAELRVKGEYTHNNEVKAALGIKIVAPNLEKVVTGSQVILMNDRCDTEMAKVEVMKNIQSLLNKLDTNGFGVYIQANTLGALEGLMSLLKDHDISISGFSVGDIHKIDIIKASSVQNLHKPELSMILAFDVNISKEMQNFANTSNVKIYKAEIIYHLLDYYNKHMEEHRKKMKELNACVVVFPCKLKMISECIFSHRDPLVFGVDVLDGFIRKGTPIFAKDTNYEIGRVIGIQKDHKEMDEARKGDKVCIKINTKDPGCTIGRQITNNCTLYSLITQESIDSLENIYMDEMKKPDWFLIMEIKKILGIK